MTQEHCPASASAQAKSPHGIKFGPEKKSWKSFQVQHWKNNIKKVPRNKPTLNLNTSEFAEWHTLKLTARIWKYAGPQKVVCRLPSINFQWFPLAVSFRKARQVSSKFKWCQLKSLLHNSPQVGTSSSFRLLFPSFNWLIWYELVIIIIMLVITSFFLSGNKKWRNRSSVPP